MECNFPSLNMQVSYRVVRGMLLPFCSTRTLQIQVLRNSYNGPQKMILCSNMSKYSCIALNSIEQNYPFSDLGLDCVEIVPESVSDGIQGIPRKLNHPNLTYSLKIRKNDGEGSRICKERLMMYSGMLRKCASRGSLNEGKAIHGQVVVNGIVPDTHLWISLMNAYSKCGSLKCVLRVFEELPERDVVSWTTLIAGFVAGGNGGDGVRLFCEMRESDVRPNEFTLATVLKACSLSSNINFGKQVHVEVIKVGAFSDVYVGSALVDLYAKFDEMKFAEQVFLCMPEQNAVSCNVLLNGYAQKGDAIKLLNLFCKMTELEMKFSNFTLSTVLKGCANSKSLREGKSLHSLAIKVGCDLDAFTSCSLLDMYSKCGIADDSLKVFRSIKNPDIVAWSAMISCLDQQEKTWQAAKLFRHMRRTGIHPNQYTLASVLSAASDLGDLNYGKGIHALTYKYMCASDNPISNALITMYMKNGGVQEGYRVFQSIDDRDLVSWNALLAGFHDTESSDQGPRIFSQILVKGLNPNMYTFISILRSCSSLTSVEYGKQVHAHVIKNNLGCDDYIGTALVDMYAKNKCLEAADIVFKNMIEKDVFTWTVIISSHAQDDQAEKAVKYFREMQRSGVKPNEYTLATCLSCCSRISTLDNGQQFHSMAIKYGHFDDLFVSSALVDMYGKCGCIEDAEAIFENLGSRDTVLWNTIICGYEIHGQGNKALGAFNRMIDDRISPDEVTFIGVLSACSHMGLIEEGKGYFNSLSNDYKLIPTINHYACMVDILARAGKFDEVKSFVEEMELTPTALIWETILGACKLHGNLELGQIAGGKLFELTPEEDSNYILLSNIFASKGQWDDVKRIRNLMTGRGIKKEPGCSWVEVEGQVHVFLAQDGSHPKICEIHLKLEELNHKLTALGYIAKTEHVHQNVTDSEKKENLLFHSERLALAFALLSSINKKKVIRIYKNLRICVDCHDVMKLMSDITSREIIVRDLKRFHHFKNGTCSCQDYW